jgi:hypothetical protein
VIIRISVMIAVMNVSSVIAGDCSLFLSGVSEKSSEAVLAAYREFLPHFTTAELRRALHSGEPFQLSSNASLQGFELAKGLEILRRTWKDTNLQLLDQIQVELDRRNKSADSWRMTEKKISIPVVLIRDFEEPGHWTAGEKIETECEEALDVSQSPDSKNSPSAKTRDGKFTATTGLSLSVYRKNDLRQHVLLQNTDTKARRKIHFSAQKITFSEDDRRLLLKSGSSILVYDRGNDEFKNILLEKTLPDSLKASFFGPDSRSIYLLVGVRVGSKKHLALMHVDVENQRVSSRLKLISQRVLTELGKGSVIDAPQVDRYFGADGKMMFAVGAGSKVMIFVPEAKIVREIELPRAFKSLKFSENGFYLFVSSSEKKAGSEDPMGPLVYELLF